MKRTYGEMPNDVPAGYFKEIRFPVLAMVNRRTGDGRLLVGDGGDTRPLPVPIMFKNATGGSGHDGAVLAGALFQVTFNDDDTVSGTGFLLDDDNGRYMARAVATKALNGNSVDLAETEAVWEFADGEDKDPIIKFVDWSIAATTGVPVPAFVEAYAEVDMSDDELGWGKKKKRMYEEDDEIVASLLASDMPLICEFADHDFTTKIAGEEITAAGTLVQPWEAFFQPEPDGLQKLTVDERGWVSGHLASWQSCHDGIEGRCVTVPRPNDNYASFNKPGVLTDQGIVDTGPIFLYGGHVNGADLERAYGGAENAWADVRCIEGRHGPWLSGIVRPGVTDEDVYVARASRISGHWRSGRLKAIVSVNAEGFDVPGSGFAFRTDEDGHILDMVASFPFCTGSDTDEFSNDFGDDVDLDELTHYVLDFVSPEDPDDEFAVDIDITPTAEMAAEARRGLEWRREFRRGGTSVGVARARDISNRKNLSLSTVKRMNSYFARHEVDKKAPAWSPGNDGYPSAGRIAWALWGGDAGRTWARNIVSRVDKARENAASVTPAQIGKLLAASIDDD